MARHTIKDIDDLISTAHANRQLAAKKGLIDHRGRWVEPAAPTEEKKPHTHKSYCLKCNKSVDSITESVKPDSKRNVHRAAGKCSTCGTKTHKIMNNADGIKMLGDMATTGGTA